MTSSPKYSVCQSSNVLPLLSLNDFAWTVGIPRSRLERLASKASSFYDPFIKKTKSKDRVIDNPTGFLKEVQALINKRILSTIVFPDYVIGGIKGRDPMAHPQAHVGKPVVVTVDARSCFQNITNKQIFDVWHKQLNCSPEVAHLATMLTTFNGHVPLGAPTSNHLAVLVLLPILDRINGIAKQFRFTTPTQYIDDLALSGRNLPNELLTLVIKEFSRGKVKINRKKIKVMRSSGPQHVTGKIVNTKIGVPASEKNNIRAALHKLSVTSTQDPAYKKLYRSTKGRIYYLKGFHPKLAEKMLNELKEIPDL